jgi:serine/threonine protein kinase
LSFEHDEFKNVSQESIGLIKDILNRDPNKRITIDQTLTHGIFPKHQEIKYNLDITKVKKSLDTFVNQCTL